MCLSASSCLSHKKTLGNVLNATHIDDESTVDNQNENYNLGEGKSYMAFSSKVKTKSSEDIVNSHFIGRVLR